MSLKIEINKLTNKERTKINEELLLILKNDSKILADKEIQPFDIVNNYIYLPFHYASNELTYKRPDRNLFPSMNVKFEGKLRDEQIIVKKEALEKLTNKGCTILSLHTGFGKTILAINLACNIKLKTLIIVNKIILIKQWEESILNFCPTALVQKLTTKSKMKDADFYIMNAMNIEKMGRKFYENIALVICDECLPGNTRIALNNESEKIETIYEQFSQGKNILVKTFNEKTALFENKKVLNAKKIKLDKNMVDIEFCSKTRKTRSTDNHRFLTDRGYIEAGKLKINDLIISYTSSYFASDISRALNDDQKQIILGSFLGDGHIDILRSGRTRLKVIHGADQKEYCNWKASMFDVNIKKIENNGYAKKLAYKFQTNFFDFSEEFPKKKGDCPQWLIDMIDERALAIWYMDDGTFYKEGNGIRFYTNSFNENSVKRLIVRLFLFGIESNLGYNKGMPIIILNNKNTNLFIKLIAPYAHESMKYKFICENYYRCKDDHNKNIDDIFNKKEYIPLEKLIVDNEYKVKGKGIKNISLYKWKYCKKCIKLTFHYIANKNKSWRCKHYIANKNTIYNWNIHNFYSYNWNSSFLNYGFLKIKNIIIDENPVEKYVFDIEVEDNHNFIISGTSRKCLNGPVVHNCHLLVAETLSKSLQYLTPRYLIALSATPYRLDGLNKLLDLYFGEDKIIREMSREHIIYKVNTGIVIEMELVESTGKVNWGAVLKAQSDNEERNDLIIKIIQKFNDRNFLVLCKRVEQAQYLFNKLKDLGEYTDNLIGSKQDFDRDCRILVGIHQKVGTGFDWTKADALLLATDLDAYFIQSLGRVFRKKDTVPIVFDLVDKNFILLKHFKSRAEVYEKVGGKIVSFNKKYPDFF